jgi:hypothetical protein
MVSDGSICYDEVFGSDELNSFLVYIVMGYLCRVLQIFGCAS